MSISAATPTARLHNGHRARRLAVVLIGLAMGATSLAVTTNAATAQPLGDLASAVWPVPTTTTRFADPSDAAESFATEFLAIPSPTLGPFMPGDSRSGEIEIIAPGSGRNTTVLLRQLGAGDDWFVIGAANETIEVDQPTALAVVSSPVTVSGRSVAFEATVPVQVRADNNPTPLGSGIVMGGSGPDLEPFSGTIAFSAAGNTFGTVVFLDVSAATGDVDGASVVRVQFAPAPTTTTTPPSTPSSQPAAPVPAAPVSVRPSFTG